jgi:hypothetical protein
MPEYKQDGNMILIRQRGVSLPFYLGCLSPGLVPVKHTGRL